MPRLAWALVFALLIAISACSGLLEDGYSSGGPAQADASAPSESDSGVDAPADASVDLCQSTLLCEDFEHDSLLGGFDKASGDVTISSVASRSSTRSLKATLISRTSNASLEKNFTRVPSTVTLSLWLQADKAPTPGYNMRVASALWGADCDWELAMALFISSDSGLSLEVATYDATSGNCGPVDQKERTLLTPSELFVAGFHHIVVSMDVSAKTRRVESSIDAESGGRSGLADEITSKQSSVPTDLQVAVGLPCVTTNSGCQAYGGSPFTVFIDDVIVRR